MIPRNAVDTLELIAEPYRREIAKLQQIQMDMLNRMVSPPLILKPGEIIAIPKTLDIKPGGDNEVKVKKAKPEKFNTIGVRFLNDPSKIYSYKIRIGAKVQLGQELVVDTDTGTKAVAVVRIDKTPCANAFKYVERKTVAL